MNEMELSIRKIAVIGAGIMGHGIAQMCAQAGKKVVLIDSIAEVIQSAPARIENSVRMLCENGLLPSAKVSQIMANLTFTTQLEEGIRAADVAFEVIPEKLEIKQVLFKELDTLCEPSVIFASNTSAIPIHLLAECSKHPERVIGTHFFNPAQLVPLVEVITPETTSTAVLRTMMEFFRSAGKKPVHVRKDIPGFIGNRLQTALAREAMSLLQKDVASAEDIDTVLKYSVALRMPFSGILEQRDLNGLDTHLSVTKTLYPNLEDAKDTLLVLRDKVARGEYGLKTGKGFYDWTNCDRAEVARRKNQQLVSLLKFFNANPATIDVASLKAKSGGD
jgi:3-hydroxybutyryl-CoA dehydrogenase